MRERLGYEVPIGSDHRLDLLAREREQPTDDSPRLPTEFVRQVEARPDVPAELTFDRPQVIEPGLDLDHEERPALPIERYEVDPAVRPTMDDLDFSGRQPTGSPQASIGIAGASSMNDVARSDPHHDWWPGHKTDVDVQRPSDPIDEVEWWIRSPDLDIGDVASGQTDERTEMSLGHPKAAAIVPA